MEVTLIGMGLGDPTTLTAQAVRALEGADGLIGARRLVEGLNLGREVPRYPATKGTEILEILCRSGLERPCVLYSGDTGFYSVPFSTNNPPAPETSFSPFPCLRDQASPHPTSETRRHQRVS